MKTHKHYVLYSHGFGVTKTARGLFTDISESMPVVSHILFGYNMIDTANNTLTVSRLQDQVAAFKRQLSNIEEDAIIDVIAHSQGCLVVALAHPARVRKVLFLAPPDIVDVNRLISFFGNRPNSTININDESLVSRRDGSTTIIPASYWQSIKDLKVTRLYNRLAEDTKLTLYIATDDEVLGYQSFGGIDDGSIRSIEIQANHDFTDSARKEIIELVKAEIGS